MPRLRWSVVYLVPSDQTFKTSCSRNTCPSRRPAAARPGGANNGFPLNWLTAPNSPHVPRTNPKLFSDHPAGIGSIFFGDLQHLASAGPAAHRPAQTAAADIIAIAGSHPASEALGAALVVAVTAVQTTITAKQPGVARAAVTAAQAASAAAQADPTISGDATSMTALGTVDTDLSTLAADVAAAPTAVYAVITRIPGE